MSDTTTLGFVAAGKRARSLMADLYTIRDQEYFLAEREDSWPESVYDTFAEETPPWVDGVSDLHPEITAVMNPGEDNRNTAYTLCCDHGDDPDLFATLEAFLEEGHYDAVVVASPNDLHVDAVLPLLDRDVTVFCEKPLATTLEDHDRIIEAERNSNAPFYVGFQRRVAPYYRKIKSLLDDGVM